METKQKEEKEPLIIGGQKIYLDGYLKKKLDLVLTYQEKDFDVPILVDGQEGSGKSILALTLAWYLSNGNITVDNICEGSHDAIMKLERVENGGVLIIDEGSLLFSSRDSMSKEQKQLVKILNVIRQKNMILIIVAPSFFDLNKYIAVHRSKCLIHIYTKGFKRGRFTYFNEQSKKLLYIRGKKMYHSYNVVKSTFRGRFTDFKPPFYEAYLKTKERSLMSALKVGLHVVNERDIKIEMCKQMHKNLPNLTQTELGTALGVTKRTVYNWLTEETRGIEGGVDEKEESGTKTYNTYKYGSIHTLPKIPTNLT